MSKLASNLDLLLNGGRVEPSCDQRAALAFMARWAGPWEALSAKLTARGRCFPLTWEEATKRRQFFRDAANTMDFAAFDELRERHADVGYMRKYLDLALYLHRGYRHAVRLGLNRSPPLSVLDLGCGPGHFLYACNHFGHAGLGLDLPGMPFLDDMAALLGVRKVNHAVLPQQPLPEIGRFGLITGFNVCFDKKSTNGGRFRFDLEDWEFLLGDLRARLNPGGKIYMRLNATPGAKGLKLEDPAFERLVERMGSALGAGGRVLSMAA